MLILNLFEGSRMLLGSLVIIRNLLREMNYFCSLGKPEGFAKEIWALCCYENRLIDGPRL